MSRHMMREGDKRFIFGWDTPLMSFFLQVHEKDRDEEEKVVFWAGTSPETEMYEVEHLVQVASEHGLTIDSAMQSQLYREKDEGL